MPCQVPYYLYCDQKLEGQGKSVHTVGQGSVLFQLQATTSFPTSGQAGIQTLISEMDGECVTIASSEVDQYAFRE